MTKLILLQLVVVAQQKYAAKKVAFNKWLDQLRGIMATFSALAIVPYDELSRGQIKSNCLSILKMHIELLDAMEDKQSVDNSIVSYIMPMHVSLTRHMSKMNEEQLNNKLNKLLDAEIALEKSVYSCIHELDEMNVIVDLFEAADNENITGLELTQRIYLAIEQLSRVIGKYLSATAA